MAASNPAAPRAQDDHVVIAIGSLNHGSDAEKTNELRISRTTGLGYARSSWCSIRAIRVIRGSMRSHLTRGPSHHREVIHRGEVEVLGFQLEGQVVVKAVIADLEQEVAGLAAAERSRDPLVVMLDQVVDRLRIDLPKTELGRKDVDILRNIGSVGSVALIL